jgi:hypothetical protein
VKKQGKMESATTQKWVSWFAIILFGLLFAGSIYHLMRQSRSNVDNLIVHDVARLQEIFEKIHKDCVIVSFEHDVNYIDFLNVEKFVGSEVGAMNLLYPDQWKGPYLKDNPTMQQQQYCIVRTKSGYYIVPGELVQLSNGKVIGQDVRITPNTDIEKLMIDSEMLHSAAGALVAKINVGTTALRQGIAAAGMRGYDIGF